MTNREPFPARLRLFSQLAVAGALVASCAAKIPATNGTVDPNAGGGTGIGSGGAGNSTGNPGAGNSSGGGSATECEGPVVADAKRIVRLSFNQISVSLHTLFGDTLGNQIDNTALIGRSSATPRTFPPLAAPQEGGTISAPAWQRVDPIAAAAGAYVLANLSTVTNCGAAPTDACAQGFITAFAQKAYRRPLTAGESTSILQVYSEVKAVYTTIPEAVQYSIYAIMQAPGFLYRTEFGTDQRQAGTLTAFELASELSYFLTDGPPDAALLAAASAGTLTNPTEFGSQATRLLATPAARTNLEQAMFSYFALDGLTNVAIGDPGFTLGTMANPYSGVRESSYHEAELFFRNTLWSSPLTALITAKQSYINAALAPIYGVAFPPAGVTLDADGFGPVQLPNTRAGLITQVGFLASRSRPDVPSVVGRGLAMNAALLCAVNPAFPTDDATKAAVAAANIALATASERDKSAYRTSTSPCLACHRNFDAYGLALDTYDIIGRYRTLDPQGRPIDASVTLPALAGGGTAVGAVDMATQIAASPGFAACLTKNMLNWALAEGSDLKPTSCSTQSVAGSFSGTADKSFSALLHEIAVSQAFMSRTAGVN